MYGDNFYRKDKRDIFLSIFLCMNTNTILLKQLKEGSYKAFNCLYEQHFDLLYGFIFSLTRSHEQTMELVQESFIKVWVNREKIETDLSFKAWLYKMAKNQLLDQLKKQLHTPLFEDYLDYCADENISVNAGENSFDYEAFCQSLTIAKAKLSPRQAEVFGLCKEQGYSTTEVSRLLNISENVVYNYLSQAISTLRKEMPSHFYLFVLLLLLK